MNTFPLIRVKWTNEHVNKPVFSITLLLLPALILSIPFMKFRPFSSAGFLLGMAASMIYRQEFGFDNFIIGNCSRVCLAGRNLEARVKVAKV